MKVLSPRRPINETQQSSQTLGRGMDFALVVLVFFGIGWALDSWLGTKPWCMISLVVVGFVGQFIKMYYEYTATMEQLEAHRAAKTMSGKRVGQQQ